MEIMNKSAAIPSTLKLNKFGRGFRVTYLGNVPTYQSGGEESTLLLIEKLLDACNVQESRMKDAFVDVESYGLVLYFVDEKARIKESKLFDLARISFCHTQERQGLAGTALVSWIYRQETDAGFQLQCHAVQCSPPRRAFTIQRRLYAACHSLYEEVQLAVRTSRLFAEASKKVASSRSSSRCSRTEEQCVPDITLVTKAPATLMAGRCNEGYLMTDDEDNMSDTSMGSVSNNHHHDDTASIKDTAAPSVLQHQLSTVSPHMIAHVEVHAEPVLANTDSAHSTMEHEDTEELAIDSAERVFNTKTFSADTEELPTDSEIVKADAQMNTTDHQRDTAALRESTDSDEDIMDDDSVFEDTEAATNNNINNHVNAVPSQNNYKYKLSTSTDDTEVNNNVDNGHNNNDQTINQNRSRITSNRSEKECLNDENDTKSTETQNMGIINPGHAMDEHNDEDDDDDDAFEIDLYDNEVFHQEAHV